MVLRLKVFESGIFLKLKEEKVKRGEILMLFNNRARLGKYITSIIIGVPIWFVTGILITFSPEIGKAMNLDQPIDAGQAVLFVFGAQALGNILSGFLSQYFQSRKKVVLLFMLGSFLFSMILLLAPVKSVITYYILCACLGIFSGYWTIFITVAAELFGSNLRATVATTVPNFVRATIIPLTSMFLFFKGYTDTIYSALLTGIITYTLGIVALIFLEETFKKDMDYTE
jgi:MFS family permease